MKPYIKLYSLIMLCAFFGANITLAGCNDENSDALCIFWGEYNSCGL